MEPDYKSFKLEIKLLGLLIDVFKRYHHFYSLEELTAMKSRVEVDRLFLRHGSSTAFALLILAKRHANRRIGPVFKALSNMRAAERMRIASSTAKGLRDKGIDRQWEGTPAESTRKILKVITADTSVTSSEAEEASSGVTIATSDPPNAPPSQQTESTPFLNPTLRKTNSRTVSTEGASPDLQDLESVHPAAARMAWIRQHISERLNITTKYRSGHGILFSGERRILFRIRAEYLECLARDLFQVSIFAMAGRRCIYRDGIGEYWGPQEPVSLGRCHLDTAARVLGGSLANVLHQGGDIRLEVPEHPFQDAALIVDY